MTHDELIALRTRLRQRLIVQQQSLPSIARGCGVSATALGVFLADGPLAEDKATYLYSYLYFTAIEDSAEVARLVRGEFVPLAAKFRILAGELRREYNVSWYLKRDFMKLPEKRRRLELAHMEERAKAELLKVHEHFLAHNRLTLSDGDSYWKWKERLGRYKTKAFARGARPETIRTGHDYPPAKVERPTSLSWRGR